MEDAATAEITRVQLWQWVKYGVRTEDGQSITPEYIDGFIKELGPTVQKLAPGVKAEHVKLAEDYLKLQIRKQWPSEFLTSDLMPYLAVADGVEPQFQRAQL
jgi:malate synthase